MAKIKAFWEWEDNQKNMIKISLNIIMKNEAKVLPRFLNSVCAIIDYYVVVDTGSTDNSKQIVKDFFDSKGIKGEIHDHPFVNFEDARNFALSKSKQTDFSLIVDPDEKLIISEGFKSSELKEQLSDADKGTIEVRNGAMVYGRMAFFRNSKPFRWQGVVHEVLLCDERIIDKSIKGIYIDATRTNEGQQGQTTAKYLQHIEMLHEAIKKNGLEPRNVFYLAQSYKDAGKPKEAIEWYEVRTTLQNGFFEEIYYSRLMIAGLKWQLGFPIMDIADEYMRCGELDELRAEHLYFLKNMYENNGRPNSAKKINELRAKYKNPYPNRVLFIDERAYQK
jgi:glycosyltransferase involved in cell wall biosynthesis